jgi:hypothetical protein
MCRYGIFILVLGLIFSGLVGVRSYVLFMRYCERIASIEKRESEFASDTTNDDVGNNAFVNEHYTKLLQAYYLQFNDENLNSLAVKCKRWLGLSMLLAICSIVLFAWLDVSNYL